MRKVAYPNNPLTRKMHAKGWDTIEDFFNNSKVREVTSKTTLHHLILQEKKIVEPLFIKIAEAMGFTPNEIKDLLVQYGYKDFVNLIGDHKGVVLNERERALISVCNKISNRHPNTAMLIVNFLETLCLTTEVDCFDELSILKKKD
jgi:hypothetical protein